MIFDWKNDKEVALANGIYKEKIYSVTRITMKATDGVVAYHTFRNFEKLEFEDGTKIVDCVFEDCGDITFDECAIEGCTFKRVETVFLTRSSVNNCSFSELVCDNDLILSVEDTTIAQCRFDDVELRNNSYLCDGVGTSWVEQCNFSHIRSSRDDKEIIHCEETVGKIFKRKKEFCIVDKDSCTGLNCIAGLDGAIEIGSFSLC
jgi:hypothetical protein